MEFCNQTMQWNVQDLLKLSLKYVNDNTIAGKKNNFASK